MSGIVHLAIGVGLAMGYALLADPWLPGPRWARGAVYSLLPWALAMLALGQMVMAARALLNPSPAVMSSPLGID